VLLKKTEECVPAKHLYGKTNLFCP